MTIRGFGDEPDEAALSKHGSKRVVINIADRWFTWILPAKLTASMQRGKVSHLFPAVSRGNIVRKRNSRVVHEDVYL